MCQLIVLMKPWFSYSLSLTTVQIFSDMHKLMKLWHFSKKMWEVDLEVTFEYIQIKEEVVSKLFQLGIVGIIFRPLNELLVCNWNSVN